MRTQTEQDKALNETIGLIQSEWANLEHSLLTGTMPRTILSQLCETSIKALSAIGLGVLISIVRAEAAKALDLQVDVGSREALRLHTSHVLTSDQVDYQSALHNGLRDLGIDPGSEKDFRGAQVVVSEGIFKPDSKVSFLGKVQGKMPYWGLGEVTGFDLLRGEEDAATTSDLTATLLSSDHGVLPPTVDNITILRLQGAFNTERPDLTPSSGALVFFKSQFTAKGAEQYQKIFGVAPQPDVDYLMMLSNEQGDGWLTAISPGNTHLTMQILMPGTGDDEGYWVVPRSTDAGFSRVLKIDENGNVSLLIADDAMEIESGQSHELLKAAPSLYKLTVADTNDLDSIDGTGVDNDEPKTFLHTGFTDAEWTSLQPELQAAIESGNQYNDSAIWNEQGLVLGLKVNGEWIFTNGQLTLENPQGADQDATQLPLYVNPESMLLTEQDLIKWGDLKAWADTAMTTEDKANDRLIFGSPSFDEVKSSRFTFVWISSTNKNSHEKNANIAMVDVMYHGTPLTLEMYRGTDGNLHYVFTLGPIKEQTWTTENFQDTNSTILE